MPCPSFCASRAHTNPLNPARPPPAPQVIYGGAQKNIGPSGVTIAIIREDLLGKARPQTPTMLDYKIHADNDSLYNTPPCWSIYICGLVFERLLRIGGLEAVEANNKKKAALIYDVIEASNGFYRCPVDKSVRSLMNIPFTMETEALEKDFLKEADKRGLLQLKARMRDDWPMSPLASPRACAVSRPTPHRPQGFGVRTKLTKPLHVSSHPLSLSGAPLRRGHPRVGVQRDAARGGAGARKPHEGAEWRRKTKPLEKLRLCYVCTVRWPSGFASDDACAGWICPKFSSPQEFMAKHSK